MKELIKILSDGQFHSGEDLGRVLGVSRAAVWKRLARLAEWGVALESVRGKGYRIPGGLELLDESLLSRESGVPVQVLDETPSTNDEALQRLRSGESGFSVLAERQSAGRGRRGRPWVSPYGGSLFLSFGYAFPVGALYLEGLSLAVGVLVAQQLEALGLEGVTLKWPNDIWVGDKKMGGILIELTGDLQDSCAAVIGIGLNGKLPLQVKNIDQLWTDFMLETGKPLPRNALAAALSKHLLTLCRDYPLTGFAAWRKDFDQRDALKGKVVVVSTARQQEGLALGVNDVGALKVRIEGQECLFNGGEVSLRPVTRGLANP